jgi:GNAT superfamily N-acetyltransferase
MSSFRLRPVTAGDAAAVTDVVVALETALYGGTACAQSSATAPYANAVSSGAMEGLVHPDAQGRGAGAQLVAALEQEAAAGGAHRVQGGVFEADAVGRSLFESLGYRPVRTFREMRIALDSAPPPPSWPAGLRAQSFDPERDAHDFHAAHQEAFADR